MSNDSYLSWLIRDTRTVWWHDSADTPELRLGLERGAVGVTTNPFLTDVAVRSNRDAWAEEIQAVIAQAPGKEQKAEGLMRIVVTNAARMFLPEFERSGGRMGYVCAQVNPLRAGDREAMLPMAQRFHDWAPNIAVKLPATAAGLDVLEECTSQGITATATVSFTVPQVVAVAEAHRRGIRRARANGTEPGRCFAVIMIGRLDDYLREVAQDTQAGLEEAEIRQAGLAVSKRAYQIYRQCRYEAVLLIAALRGAHHFTELAGGELIMSIAPKYQELFVGDSLAREVRIDQPAPEEAVGRLRRVPEFVRAYEPDGMAVKEFIGYGVTQRTLSQFAELGWNLLENFR
mgnify:CR=1 FL=1